MITIIFGEDVSTSRNKLLELITGRNNVIRVDGKKQSIPDIKLELEGNSLFSEKKTVVIDFFTKTKPQKDFFELVLKFEKDPDTDIFLWEGDDLDVKSKNAFKNAKTLSFSFPKFYYTFLDGFMPHSKNSVELLSEVLKTYEPEQVLYGLIRRVRQLLLLKSGREQEFSEFARMQSWQTGKLKKQANLWTESQLKKAFIGLAELDEKIKTSGLTMSLQNHLDILMLSDL